MSFENIYGYQRKHPNTKERIFPLEDKEQNEKKIKKKIDSNAERGNRNRNYDHLSEMISKRKEDDKIQKMPTKPCNNDFQAVADEARKNASVRYYFENNLSHW